MLTPQHLTDFSIISSSALASSARVSGASESGLHLPARVLLAVAAAIIVFALIARLFFRVSDTFATVLTMQALETTSGVNLVSAAVATLAWIVVLLAGGTAEGAACTVAGLLMQYFILAASLALLAHVLDLRRSLDVLGPSQRGRRAAMLAVWCLPALFVIAAAIANEQSTGWGSLIGQVRRAL